MSFAASHLIFSSPSPVPTLSYSGAPNGFLFWAGTQWPTEDYFRYDRKGISLMENRWCRLRALLTTVYTGDFCRSTQCNFRRAEFASSCDFIAIFSVVYQCKTSVHVYFVKQKLCAWRLKSETATESHCVSWVASQTAAINCTKIVVKSQLFYTGDFEAATSTRQKLHCIVRQKSPV